MPVPFSVANFWIQKELSLSADDLLQAAEQSDTIFELVARNIPEKYSEIVAEINRDRIYFRGQKQADWGLVGSLYRSLGVHANSGVTERMMLDAEESIIKALRSEGLGLSMTDGELYMTAQHHGIPTRLMDFSESVLPALYFACEAEDQIDGRLFLIARGEAVVELDMQQDQLPWAEGAADRSWSPRAGTQGKVGFVRNRDLDPRMRAQSGVFFAGQVLGRVSDMQWYFDGSPLTLDRMRRVCGLNIYFPERGSRSLVAKKAPVLGWSIRIPAELKPQIREILHNKHGIWEESIYPKFGEARALGSYIAAQHDPSRSAPPT